VTDRNIVEGLVVESDGHLDFLGSRCDACGETIFPAIDDCPLCSRPGTMTAAVIPGTGVVRRAIVAERGPAGFPVPYVQAYVALDAGPVVYSTLDVPVDEVDVIVGGRVEAFMAALSEVDGRVNQGWKFRRAAHAA
jgi:uncharacterized OB-fold protein